MKQAGRFLSKYIKRNFGVFAIYMLLCILCSILSLIAPYISGNFIDVLLHIEQREQLVKYCVVFATMSFGSIACNYIISQIFARLRIKMNYEINMDFLHHIRKISILTLQKQTTASITQKLNYDTGIVTSFSLQTLQNILMLCELIRLFTVIIIKNYWKGNLIDLPLKINVFLCLIHILGIISCCIVVRVIWLYDIPEEWLLCTSIIFIVLFINILIFSVFKKMNTIYASIYEKEMIIQEAKLKEAYYSEVDKSSQYLRKIRHDLKNKLIGIYGIEDDNELIRTKIKEIIGELEDSKKNLYTDNCILNSVLNIKYSAAQVADIKIESNIFVPKYMNIDYGDMGVLFGNLLDNAIEANQGVDRKKRWINVSVKYEEHILIINIKNSKIRGSRRKKKGYLNHGIGLNSVKQIVEKFNGICS